VLATIRPGLGGQRCDPESHHREHRGHRGRKERVSDPDPNFFSFPSTSVNAVLSVVKFRANLRKTVVSTYGATNTLKLLEVPDGKPTWRRPIRGPPVLAKDATWSEAAGA